MGGPDGLGADRVGGIVGANGGAIGEVVPLGLGLGVGGVGGVWG